MSLSLSTIKRMIIALSASKEGNNLVGAVGLYGGCQFGSAGAVAGNTGDWSCIPDSGGAPGTYRMVLTDSSLNQRIASIDWFNVTGFTPRTPTAAETASALVTGYNKDATTGQWYITVQIVGIDSQAIITVPTGFVLGVRAAVSYVVPFNRL